MDIDSKNGIHTFRAYRLVQADSKIEHVKRLFLFSTNPCKIIWSALGYPIIMSGAELACMDSNDKALDDDTHPLLVNRVFAPHDWIKDVTFATRWIRHVGTKFHPNVRGYCIKLPHV